MTSARKHILITTSFQKRLKKLKHLFAERLSLRDICRAVNVSLTWVFQFFRDVTDETPDDVGVLFKEQKEPPTSDQIFHLAFQYSNAMRMTC